MAVRARKLLPPPRRWGGRPRPSRAARRRGVETGDGRACRWCGRTMKETAITRSLRRAGAGERRYHRAWWLDPVLAGVYADFSTVTWNRVNPNGGSVAIGHPFGATGARDLS